MSDNILTNYLQIQERIIAAISRSGRDPSNVRLVAATKSQSAQTVNQYIQTLQQAGHKPIIGENYVQEFCEKKSVLSSKCETHFIGGLQSNKAKIAVEIFDLVESVASIKLAEALNNEAQKAGKVLDVLLQVNISCDGQKRGFDAAEIPSFISEHSKRLSHLNVLGLMTITRAYEKAELARADFAQLANLGAKSFSGGCELSMGMSQDFEVAIEEGATLVRLGTALFGPRS